MINYKIYLLVLSPGEVIINDIHTYKLRSKGIVGDFGAMDSLAHVTVRPELVRSRREMLKTLDRFEQALKYLPPISLQTDGFAVFNDNRTIYAKVKVDAYVRRWFDLLREYVSTEKKIEPHITVTKTLSSDKFDLLWPYFKDRDYQRSFYVDHITVLERDLSGGRFRPIRKLHFGSRKVELNRVLTLFDLPVSQNAILA